MDLQGKKVVITGGAVRVGAALVRTFAQQGARVLIHCRSSVNEAYALLEEIGGEKDGHSVVTFDLNDLDSVRSHGRELFSDASVLVNNASVFLRRKFTVEDEVESSMQWNVNFHAPVLLMKLFARYVNGGVIINMLDQGICRSDENSFSYALSKKALADATKSAALQLAPRIRVNGIAPGPVLPPVGLENSGMKKTLRQVPLGRPVGLDDLCRGAVFLAENESVTGTVLFIDCGQSLCQEERFPATVADLPVIGK